MTCEKCGAELRIGEYPFCPHGFGAGSRIGDECDFYDDNFERRFTSKAEHDRAIKEAGFVRKVRHVPLPGTDKSQFTSRWDTCPASLLVSEEDRLRRWHEWDRLHGLTPPSAVLPLVLPDPEPFFSDSDRRELGELASKLGL